MAGTTVLLEEAETQRGEVIGPRSHSSHFLNAAGLFSRRRIREVSALAINCSSLEEAHIFSLFVAQ